MTTTIRNCAAHDLDAVLRCFARSVREIGARYYDAAQVAAWSSSAVDRAAWARRLAEPGAFVADADGAVAGFALVHANGYIDLLYVDPDFERRGIGRQLLEHACAFATLQGAQRLTSDVSLAARPLFEALGFVVEREQRVARRGVELVNFHMSRPAAGGAKNS